MTNIRLMVSGLLTLAGCGVIDAQAAPGAPQSLNIESQPLDRAINAWAAQTGYQVLLPAESAAITQVVPGVKGSYVPYSALNLLLASSSYGAQFINAKTVAIRLNTPAPGGTIRLAQAERGGTSADSAVAGREKVVEEILVTAQKRSERLQDVPVPVSAIRADGLVSGNQLRVQDYYTRIPGFTVTPAIVGAQTLSIRGVTTGYGTNPTVGVTVDDVPFGSSTNNGGGFSIPDLDPGELESIEVLRGPQGTLYGANSMGGLLKFVTVDPSTDGVTGRVQAGLSSVRNGDSSGYNVRGSMNLPLSETWALRASGFTRRDPGYIDDPVQGKEGVNQADVRGGRVSTLWTPSDVFSLKLAAILQKTEGDGVSSVDPALGELKQARLRGTGQYERKVQAYSAAAKAQFGGVELTSLTGYNINGFTDSFDGSFIYAGLVQPRFGVSSAELYSDNETKKFTQELRFAMPLGPRVDWLFGGFYTDEKTDYSQEVFASDPATGAHVGSLRLSVFPTTFEEYAAFTDLTFHVTDRFDLQVGGRESELRQDYQQVQTGPGATPTGNVPLRRAKASAFTYLLTPRFKLSTDMMLYARLASGYRAGGPNSDAGVGTPSQYDPDKTKNYEIGFKGSFLDGALSIDTSVYHIDWEDIQLVVINPATVRSYNTNGGRAQSQGVELTVESRPIDGLRINGWLAWNDATLTEDLPATATVRAFDGTRLPNTSRFSGNLSVDQDIRLGGAMTAVLGGSLGYVGDRQSVFTGGTGARQTFPSYTKVDLHAALRRDSWLGDLSVTNLTDRRGVLYGGIGALPPTAYIYIQPRTIAVSLTKTF